MNSVLDLYDSLIETPNGLWRRHNVILLTSFIQQKMNNRSFFLDRRVPNVLMHIFLCCQSRWRVICSSCHLLHHQISLENDESFVCLFRHHHHLKNDYHFCNGKPITIYHLLPSYLIVSIYPTVLLKCIITHIFPLFNWLWWCSRLHSSLFRLMNISGSRVPIFFFDFLGYSLYSALCCMNRQLSIH